MREYAAALADEPWLDRWPMVLHGVVPAPAPWRLVDRSGEALPLDLVDPWRLMAAAGGAPVTVAGEWSVAGLRPLALWSADRLVRP